MKQSLPQFSSLSDTAVKSIAAGHERPDFREAAQDYLKANGQPKSRKKGTKTPKKGTTAAAPVTQAPKGVSNAPAAPEVTQAPQGTGELQLLDANETVTTTDAG